MKQGSLPSAPQFILGCAPGERAESRSCGKPLDRLYNFHLNLGNGHVQELQPDQKPCTLCCQRRNRLHVCSMSCCVCSLSCRCPCTAWQTLRNRHTVRCNHLRENRSVRLEGPAAHVVVTGTADEDRGRKGETLLLNVSNRHGCDGHTVRDYVCDVLRVPLH